MQEKIWNILHCYTFVHKWSTSLRNLGIRSLCVKYASSSFFYNVTEWCMLFINTHISTLYLTCTACFTSLKQMWMRMFNKMVWCVWLLRVFSLSDRLYFPTSDTLHRDDIRVNKRASRDARQVGAASYPGISAFTRCLATTLSAATTSVRMRRAQQGASCAIGEARGVLSCLGLVLLLFRSISTHPSNRRSTKAWRSFFFINDAPPPKKSTSSDAKEIQHDPVLREHYIRDQDESPSPALC